MAKVRAKELRVSVILPAAGKGRRLGAGKNKVLLPLCGQPMIAWSLDVFSRIRAVREILIPCAPKDRAAIGALIARRYPKARLVMGGKERFDSVGNGLRESSPESDLVAIHDAARPLVSRSEIEQTLRAAHRYGGAILAIPATDTAKRSLDGRFVLKTVPRDTLWRAQTPQVFRRGPFLRAYERAQKVGRRSSDDAGVAEAAGMKVALVLGSEANLKITTKDQLALAKVLLR